MSLPIFSGTRSATWSTELPATRRSAHRGPSRRQSHSARSSSDRSVRWSSLAAWSCWVVDVVELGGPFTVGDVGGTVDDCAVVDSGAVEIP